MIDSLHLNIISCSCRCGNRWTHSHTWLASRSKGYLGGSPTPDQSFKLPYSGYSHHHWNVDGCFRCVPIALGPMTEPSFQEPPANQPLVDRATAAKNELLA